jgi:uncharacterized protein (TIGR02647 family)
VANPHLPTRFCGTFIITNKGFPATGLRGEYQTKKTTMTRWGQQMNLNSDLINEIDLLMKFDLSSARVGLKVHSNADPEVIAAAKRLYAKELVEHEDGGFLTSLGHEAAEHLQAVHVILSGVK